jgi:hypothetical protein
MGVQDVGVQDVGVQDVGLQEQGVQGVQGIDNESHDGSSRQPTADVGSSSGSSSNNTTSNNNSSGVVVFTAKTYDSLTTLSIIADKVAFAPTSVPTMIDVEQSRVEPRRRLNMGRKDPPLYHPHSFILHSGLELDRTCGGLLVNQSLQVGLIGVVHIDGLGLIQHIQHMVYSIWYTAYTAYGIQHIQHINPLISIHLYIYTSIHLI